MRMVGDVASASPPCHFKSFPPMYSVEENCEEQFHFQKSHQ